jgi:hypothetical protein
MKRAYQRRKVAPKVKDGVVQKKHNHVPTTTLGYVLDRQSPAKGYRHVLTKRDIRHFIDIIPDWDALAVGIESIVLTARGYGYEGRYEVFTREKTASLQIPAWKGALWTCCHEAYFHEHRAVFERIGLAFEETEDGFECRFTLAQARAFLLLHIFVHELGHHVDRMQTKQQEGSVRGEEFAEKYANEMLDRLWPAYLERFGDPRTSEGAHGE